MRLLFVHFSSPSAAFSNCLIIRSVQYHHHGGAVSGCWIKGATAFLFNAVLVFQRLNWCLVPANFAKQRYLQSGKRAGHSVRVITVLGFPSTSLYSAAKPDGELKTALVHRDCGCDAGATTQRNEHRHRCTGWRIAGYTQIQLPQANQTRR